MHLPPRLATAAALLVMLAPIGLTIATRDLARVSADAPASLIAPLPVAAPDARPSLDGIVDPLPIVVRDLPDASSRRAVDEYDRATLLVPAHALAMFRAAWSGLVVPQGSARVVDDLGQALVVASWDRESFKQAGFRPLTTEEFLEVDDREATRVITRLTVDPRNAGRLNNAAVALFALGATTTHGPRIRDGRYELGSPYELEETAVWLLAETWRAFGGDRAVLLNLAFFAGLKFPFASTIDVAIEPAARQLASDPADHTARLLLGQLQSRRADPTIGLTQALATLVPLVDEPATRPLGLAARADALVAAAVYTRDASPFAARDLARRALSDYDAALVLTTAPGVYVGRAVALELLGAPDDAIAAHRRAIELAPRSIDLLVGLATRHEAAGDVVAMRETARAAVVLAGEGWDPPLSQVRNVPMTLAGRIGLNGRLYVDSSLGSERDHALVTPLLQAGGGYVVGSDLIPRETLREIAASRGSTLVPDQAMWVALAASVALGDVSAALADVDDWERHVAANPRLFGPDHEPDGPARLEALRAGGVAAAYLVAGAALPPGADPSDARRFAEAALRRTGRFGAAAAICRRAAEAADLDDWDRSDALRCAGETAYLAGDFAAAADALTRAFDPDEPFGEPDDSPRWELRRRAAAAAEAAGDRDTARRLFSLDAIEDNSPIGFLKLGDLDLDDGDWSGAIASYGRTLALLQRKTEEAGEFYDPAEAARDRVLAQRALNNRGIALLQRSQPDATTPPDCSLESGDACRGARIDFAAALAIDSRNPTYLLNAGWAARLLGDNDGALATLREAVEVDPSVFPALNDLGVFAALAGDAESARGSFLAALVVEPNYDLAAWNLGVLEMARGLPGIPIGQAYLARAIALTPSFRDEPLDFKTDERVYRLTVAPTQPIGLGWAFGGSYSIAAAAFGSFTLLAVALGVLSSLGRETLGDKLKEIGGRYLPTVAVIITAGAGNLMATRRPGRWWRTGTVWVLTAVVLVVLTVLPARDSTPRAGASMVVLALATSLFALLIHELAHVAAAAWARVRVRPAPWGAGIPLALLLFPVGLGSGPFLGHRIDGRDPARTWWVTLCGPVANLIAAALGYALFRLQPLPLLLLLVQVNLAVVGYALLPFEPLDGHLLARRWPNVVAALGLLTTLAGVLLANRIL